MSTFCCSTYVRILFSGRVRAHLLFFLWYVLMCDVNWLTSTEPLDSYYSSLEHNTWANQQLNILYLNVFNLEIWLYGPLITYSHQTCGMNWPCRESSQMTLKRTNLRLLGAHFSNRTFFFYVFEYDKYVPFILSWISHILNREQGHHQRPRIQRASELRRINSPTDSLTDWLTHWLTDSAVVCSAWE